MSDGIEGKIREMQVIGLCRFSYPALGGFQVEHDTIEERAAYLYASSRMEERFTLFEAITLPGIKAQTDPDFTLVVVIGEAMPAEYESRLRDLCASVPQIQIRKEPPERHRPIMQRILNETRRNKSDPCLQFRLDDDDGVAVDFVQELRLAASDCPGMLKRHKFVAFDFNNGFLGSAQAEGFMVAEGVRAYQTAALAMYVAGGAHRSIMNFGHHRIFHSMPSVTLNRRAMFLRSHNQFNDSRQKNASREEMHLVTDAERRVLKQCLAIGEEQLDQLRAFARLPS